MSDAHTNSINPTAELEQIQSKRRALLQLVKITAALNRLLQGLQSVLLLGRPSSAIPPKVVEQFQSMGEKLQEHSTDTLKNTLSSTDLRILGNVKQVLNFSRMEETELNKHIGNSGSNMQNKHNHSLESYSADFRREAQTSIALRLALKSRNVIIKALKLPIAESFLQQHIAALDQREIECRRRIQREIICLDYDINNLLQRPDCPNDLKHKLLVIKTNLQQNMQHIASGKQIEDLPMLYESIELSAAPQDVAQVEAASHSVSETTNSASLKEAINKTEPSTNVLQRIWKWLKSPMDVKWKDIK